MEKLDNIKIGAIVEYQNADDDFKLAIITQNIAGNYYDAIAFSGRKISLGCHKSYNPTHLAGDDSI